MHYITVDSIESLRPLFNNSKCVYPLEYALEAARIILLDEGLDSIAFYEF